MVELFIIHVEDTDRLSRWGRGTFTAWKSSFGWGLTGMKSAFMQTTASLSVWTCIKPIDQLLAEGKIQILRYRRKVGGWARIISWRNTTLSMNTLVWAKKKKQLTSQNVKQPSQLFRLCAWVWYLNGMIWSRGDIEFEGSMVVTGLSKKDGTTYEFAVGYRPSLCWWPHCYLTKTTYGLWRQFRKLGLTLSSIRAWVNCLNGILTPFSLSKTTVKRLFEKPY